MSMSACARVCVRTCVCVRVHYDESAQIHHVTSTMKTKNADLPALSESRWPGNGVSAVCCTTILHSGTVFLHIHGMAALLSPWARAVWEAAGSGFQPVFEQIVKIHLKSHLSFIRNCPLLSCVLLQIHPPVLPKPPLRLSTTNYSQHFPLSLHPICWS